MSEKLIRKSTKLTGDEWTALDKLAADLKCRAERGPSPGKTTWRVLLRKIAKGEIKLENRDAVV